MKLEGTYLAWVDFTKTGMEQKEFVNRVQNTAKIATNLGFNSQNYLGDKDTVLNCIIIITVWKEAGFFMIFYLAALQNIPPELKEAAMLEGSSRLYFFRRITFPLD